MSKKNVLNGTYKTVIDRGGLLPSSRTYRTRTYKDGYLTNERNVSISFTSIFTIVFALLLVAGLFSFLSGTGQPKTFYSFMKLIETTQAPDMSGFLGFLQNSTDFLNAALPDWLSWLATPWEILSSLLSLFSLLLQGFVYLFNFVRAFMLWLIV